jgi:hypothetical protein
MDSSNIHKVETMSCIKLSLHFKNRAGELESNCCRQAQRIWEFPAAAGPFRSQNPAVLASRNVLGRAGLVRSKHKSTEEQGQQGQQTS